LRNTVVQLLPYQLSCQISENLFVLFTINLALNLREDAAVSGVRELERALDRAGSVPSRIG
jgi:hypothetical protein